MDKQNPLSGIQYLTNLFTHCSVEYSESQQKFHIAKKRWLCVLISSLMFLIMNMFYLWYVYITLDTRFDSYGKILALLLILDSQLCFCWVYCILANGLLKSKPCLKLWNEHSRLRRTMRKDLRGPNYARP